MIWTIVAFVFICAGISLLAFYGGFLLGRKRSRAEQGRLLNTALREIEFRDQIRADSFEKRLVTESGNKNPGRSRVRNMKWR